MASHCMAYHCMASHCVAYHCMASHCVALQRTASLACVWWHLQWLGPDLHFQFCHSLPATAGLSLGSTWLSCVVPDSGTAALPHGHVSCAVPDSCTAPRSHGHVSCSQILVQRAVCKKSTTASSSIIITKVDMICTDDLLPDPC